MSSLPKHVASHILVSISSVALVVLCFCCFYLYSNTKQSQQILTVQNEPDTILESARCSVFDQSPNSITSQSTSYKISDGVQSRTYRVHTPDNFDRQTRYPIILSFDGVAGSGKRIESFSGLDSLPAIIVYPDSLMGTHGRTAWQGAPYSPPRANDMQFIKNVLTHVSENYCVDSSHIFTVGMSNGGGFAVLVGCELGSRIRAVASISGAFYAPCKGDVKGQSLLIIHSTADRQVPIDGSPRRKLPVVRKWVTDQAAQRSCREQVKSAQMQNATRYTWSHCGDNDATVRFMIIKNQQHGWLEVPSTAEQTLRARTAWYIWDFFRNTYATN